MKRQVSGQGWLAGGRAALLVLACCVSIPAVAQSGAGPVPGSTSEQKDEANSNEAALNAMLELMMAGQSVMQGAELEAALVAAEVHPLGSKQNPVRAHMPAGQRAYLNRLRCSNLRRPYWERQGSDGLSPFGNVVDVFEVTCEDASPARARIFMDMYHQGHIEDRAVSGFGMVGGRRAE
ncbi:MAG: hypothetical protein SXU28_01420 [Pseudomonadota bacterium]|nr:hypothetical protein [Pseudomonadota bacterium]